MFKNAKVGDRVWSFEFGWGTINKIWYGAVCPISVGFDGGTEDDFTVDGKLYANAINPTLFWDEIKFEIPSKPKRKVKKWIILMFHKTYNKWYTLGISEFPELYDTFEDASKRVNDVIYPHVINEIEIEIEK